MIQCKNIADVAFSLDYMDEWLYSCQEHKNIMQETSLIQAKRSSSVSMSKGVDPFEMMICQYVKQELSDLLKKDGDM